jgi:hypothetical protein
MRIFLCTWGLAFLLVSLRATCASAQSAPPSVCASVLVAIPGPVSLCHVNPGDKLRIKVQMMTSDDTTPESSEGENCPSVYFESLLPSFHAVNIPCDTALVNYNALYIVPSDSLEGYTAYALIPTFDGDESMSVNITVNPIDVLPSTLDEVAYFEEMALAAERGEIRAEILEQLCRFIPTHIGEQTCERLENVLATEEGVLAKYYEKLADQDPPDPNFTKLAIVQRPAISQNGADNQVATVVNQLLFNQQQQAFLMMAVTTCVNRAASAAKAGDTYSRQRQLKFAAYLLRQLSYSVTDQIKLQARLQDTWFQAGYPSLTPIASDIHNFQLNLNTSGFSAQQVQIFLRNGLKLQDIADLKTELVSFNYLEIAAIGGFPASLNLRQNVNDLQNAAQSFAKLASATASEK